MKKYFIIGILIFFLFLVYFGFTNYPKLELISGFSAKSVASGHFIDNRSLDVIEKNDNDFDVIGWATNKISESGKFSTAAVLGLKKRKAIYREGLGATLIDDAFDVTKPYEIPKRTKSNNKLPFPYGDLVPKDTVFENVNYTKLNQVVANAFDAKGYNYKRTRSVLVIYKDRIIAEKYADGFTKSSVILGWSMTKSITGTLFGILEKQRRFDIYKPAPIAEWQNDNRKYITTNDLLHMNSGLEWDEYYDRICDATKMLFQSEDMTQSQLIKQSIFKPNTHWNYSSGTTNLLSGILRKQFKTHQEYLDFWYSALIDKIGMHSMLIETDMAGNYVGSSYGWATTRDWSKLGLLYLHKGNWNGEQLFDPSWAKYVSTPTDTSHRRYGAQFWLNDGYYFPNAPRDLYYCSGFQGQMVAIIPSMDLVIVRMGLTEEPQFDFNGFLSGIVWSVKK
ncbi:MAG TPA: serine hydrolase [Flavobacterium sp.]|nr:serine hydrolase [Flavobacterium sp.]